MAKILDIQTGFRRNPLNNSVSVVSDKHAVAQFIFNLLDTSTIELPYKEFQGSGLSSLLGESCSNINASVIQEQIRTLIKTSVPYVELQDITYQIDYDNQKYIFILTYTLINSSEEIQQKLELVTNI